MSRIPNEFSWSVTRDRMFRTCLRMYYFHYYGSWGGWETEAGERTRLIYVLKQLQNRHMWAGRKVHEGIEKALNLVRRGESFEEKIIIGCIIAEMRKEFSHSKKKTYMQKPKDGGLFEHEYEVAVSDNEWKRNADHVVHCLESFFQSEVYKKIMDLPKEDWLEMEHLSYFVYHGMKIYVMLDFAFRDGDSVVVYDWKTGKEKHNRFNLQMACYGMYAEQKWYTSPDKIRLVELYLHEGREKSLCLAELDMERAQRYIRDSIAVMIDLLDDGESNRTSENRFEFTQNENLCRFCNYQKVCPRWHP
ncbi:MAG: PD-(D/E)XK nuclease family protein [Candidatus Aminicenantaceae bacterium]